MSSTDGSTTTTTTGGTTGGSLALSPMAVVLVLAFYAVLQEMTDIRYTLGGIRSKMSSGPALS